ncbi:type IV pilin [Halorussus amylolyticus]|uniref:type IV pilin n=1 Tax=Halorussus amylolyticus TaxID=1126242 RepID=UPI001EE4491A|nr:type IV pilin N-terminal domain-containing protein [Halorussus amylolyticus]
MKIKQLLSDDDAVSPVIGVILMVAITVILAAVIGTFVLGLGESVNQNASAGVTEAGNDTSVTLNSLGQNTDGIKCSGVEEFSTADNDEYTESVGSKIVCDDDGDADGNSVVAYSKDGDAQNASVYSFD